MVSPKQVQMCCVEVGYQRLLMPADKAMKLVELLLHAITCDRTYEQDDYDYRAGLQPEVSLTLIKPSQVKFPEGLPLRASKTSKQPQLLLTK